jgi:hypothetical protein
VSPTGSRCERRRKTAVAKAIKYRHWDVAQLLRSRGAKPGVDYEVFQQAQGQCHSSIQQGTYRGYEVVGCQNWNHIGKTRLSRGVTVEELIKTNV